MPGPNWTADNITECVVKGRWTNGRPVVNVFMIQREEDDAPTSARDLLDNFQDHLLKCYTAGYTLEECHYRDRNVAAGVVGSIAPNPAKPVVGFLAAPTTPPNVAVLLNKNSVLTAGQRKGRTYCVAVQEGVVDNDGILTPAILASYTTNAAAFHAGLSGAGGNRLALVHFQGPGDESGEVTIVTSVTPQARVATMRRRNRK